MPRSIRLRAFSAFASESVEKLRGESGRGLPAESVVSPSSSSETKLNAIASVP